MRLKIRLSDHLKKKGLTKALIRVRPWRFKTTTLATRRDDAGPTIRPWADWRSEQALCRTLSNPRRKRVAAKRVRRAVQVRDADHEAHAR